MVKKEFTFRGKTLPELMGMEIGEFARLVNSRAKRSLLKQQNSKLTKKIENAVQEKQKGKAPKIIKTHRRDTIVIPKMIGLKFGIHTGREFKVVEISEKMLGHYLGELAMTRGRLIHGKAGIGATKSSTAITARG